MKAMLTVVAGLFLIVLHVPLHAQTKRVVAGYSAISATQTGFYLAKDAKILKSAACTSIRFMSPAGPVKLGAASGDQLCDCGADQV